MIGCMLLLTPESLVLLCADFCRKVTSVTVVRIICNVAFKVGTPQCRSPADVARLPVHPSKACHLYWQHCTAHSPGTARDLHRV